MRPWHTLVLAGALVMLAGCNRDADKGLNADKDRPKQPEKAEVKK